MMDQQFGTLPTGQRQMTGEARDPRAAPVLMPPQPPLGALAAQQQAQRIDPQLLEAIAQALQTQAGPPAAMGEMLMRQSMLGQMKGQ